MIKKLLTLPMIITFSIMPSIAYAYLDPVTGSFLLQGLLAAFAAILVFWKKTKIVISNFFGLKRKKSKASEIIGRKTSGPESDKK